MLDKISQLIDFARKSLTSFTLLVLLLIFLLASDDMLAGIGSWGRERLRLLGFREFSVLGGSLDLGTQVADLAARADELKSAAADLQGAAGRPIGAPDGSGPGSVAQVAERLDAMARTLAGKSDTLVQQASASARPLALGATPVEGWVYLGRKDSAQRWAPPLDKLALSERDGARWLSLGKDVILIEKSPVAARSAADSRSDGPVRVVSAGNEGVEVLALDHEPSAGGGQFFWAKVRVPAARVRVTQ